MDTIARVRRAFHAQGWSMKKKITRELHVSRNTVRKILRSGETDFTYEREHQPLPRIGPWVEHVDRFLRANEGKAARERLTLIRIYEEVRALGYSGSYDAVRRYAKTWAKARGSITADAYVPLYYAPGEAYQFDWSHEIVLIGGVTVTVKVAHVRLCHSRMMFARAYMRESQEMVFDAHDRAFAFFKGTCTRGIYDIEPMSAIGPRTMAREDGGGDGIRWQGTPLQPPLPADVQPLPRPAAVHWARTNGAAMNGLHPGIGLGERPGREPGRPCARAVLHAAPAGQKPG